MKEKSLVSVVVIAYNSSKTIIETLESIVAQTYQNIELIISDDCSRDNTISIVKAWLDEHEKRFVRVELITVEKNTGVCENLNRAIKKCRGLWIKEIAADDILLPNCIDDYMSFIAKNPDASWVSSYVRVYNETFDERNCVSTGFVNNREFFDKRAEEQLYQIATWNKISAPSLFIKLQLFEEIGYYDTTYGFEDYVFSLHALENGYKCFFLDKETVGYRVHNSTYNSSNSLLNYSFLLECRKFQSDRCFKYLTQRQKFWTKFLWKVEDFIVRINCNKKTTGMSLLYKYVTFVCQKLGDL